LTGPIARGDAGTLAQHLDVLEREAPEVLPLYRLLGRETITIAKSKGGIDEERAEALAELLAPALAVTT
jgi:predicted short-subunit dehydrogenase-like oxidoreductase (DUF2520 family)